MMGEKSAVARLIFALTLWIGTTYSLTAQEYVELPEAVDDRTFYRAVACAAAPQGRCRKPVLKWHNLERPISIGFEILEPTLAPYKLRLYERGLKNAVAEVNRVQKALRLEITDENADIGIYVLPIKPGAAVSGFDVPLLEGQRLPLALVGVRAVETGRIEQASIVISSWALRPTIASILLEETIQALGLMTDIKSKVHQYRRSIFSEDSNSGTRLKGQDATALRLHYEK